MLSSIMVSTALALAASPQKPLKIGDVVIGEVSLRDYKGKNDVDFLVVKTSGTNTSTTKKRSLGMHPLIANDEHENKYRQVNIGSIASGRNGDNLEPGKTLGNEYVYEYPAAVAKALTIPYRISYEGFSADLMIHARRDAGGRFVVMKTELFQPWQESRQWEIDGGAIVVEGRLETFTKTRLVISVNGRKKTFQASRFDPDDLQWVSDRIPPEGDAIAKDRSLRLK